MLRSSLVFNSRVRRWRVLGAMVLLACLDACQAVVINPAVRFAAQRRDRVRAATADMRLIVIPIMAMTALFTWRYRVSNDSARYEPDWHRATRLERVVSSAPLVIIICVWLLQAIGSDAGNVVPINRGYAPNAAEGAAAAEGEQAGLRDDMALTPALREDTASLRGHVRITEPRSEFLRRNDPVAKRGYSRDVAAIAGALHLDGAAPHSILLHQASEPRGGPVGGLTVVRSSNSPLAYALAGLGLAAPSAGLPGHAARGAFIRVASGAGAPRL